MGNTPAHSKRRLSGEIDPTAYENTQSYIGVTIPAAKRPNMQLSRDFPHSAPIDHMLKQNVFNKFLSDSMVVEGVGSSADHEMVNVDDMTSMLRATSLRDTFLPSGEPGANAAARRVSSSSTTQLEAATSDAPAPPDRLTVSAAPTSPHSMHYIDDDMTPTERHLPTVFRWHGGGNEISLSGTFNAWETRIPMVKRNSGACVIVDCPPGNHEYKFFIDGAWYHDPTKPTIDNEYGTKNNVVEVKTTDFDVLDALEQDIASTRGTAQSGASEPELLSRSPPGEYGRYIPESPKDIYIKSSGITVNTRNPPYRVRGIPPAPGVGSFTQPPLLPPQLLQGILNKGTGAHCDPNLLPPPNHVMVNHLYALSIKDGVIVLSVISRYRQKFVSTLFYKPIQN